MREEEVGANAAPVLRSAVGATLVSPLIFRPRGEMS